VWDAGHFVLVSLWRGYWQFFPLRLHLRSRPVKTALEVIEAAATFGEVPVAFFSVLLSCGHVVRVPADFVRKPLSSLDEPGRRIFVPCYKCWAAAGGAAYPFVCSFCGVSHDSSVPCVRPHLER
jgi:hypothetical protein